MSALPATPRGSGRDVGTGKPDSDGFRQTRSDRYGFVQSPRYLRSHTLAGPLPLDSGSVEPDAHLAFLPVVPAIVRHGEDLCSHLVRRGVGAIVVPVPLFERRDAGVCLDRPDAVEEVLAVGRLEVAAPCRRRTGGAAGRGRRPRGSTRAGHA